MFEVCFLITKYRNLSEGPRNSTPLYRLIQPLVELGAPGPEKGAWTILWCAASSSLKLEDNGCYFMPIGKKTPASNNGEDRALAAKLWEWTGKALAKDDNMRMRGDMPEILT